MYFMIYFKLNSSTKNSASKLKALTFILLALSASMSNTYKVLIGFSCPLFGFAGSLFRPSGSLFCSFRSFFSP